MAAGPGIRSFRVEKLYHPLYYIIFKLKYPENTLGLSTFLMDSVVKLFFIFVGRYVIQKDKRNLFSNKHHPSISIIVFIDFHVHTAVYI